MDLSKYRKLVFRAFRSGTGTTGGVIPQIVSIYHNDSEGKTIDTPVLRASDMNYIEYEVDLNSYNGDYGIRLWCANATRTAITTVFYYAYLV